MGVMPSQQFSLNCNINTSGCQKAEPHTITTRSQVLLLMLKQQTPPIPHPSSPEKRVGGWTGQIRSGQVMANGNKKLKSETPRDLNLHRTLEPILPAVCDKNHTSLKIHQGCHKLASNDSII